MRVYRIENKEGWGPYQAPKKGANNGSELVVDVLYNVYQRTLRHPRPEDDGIPMHPDYGYSHVIFGFATLRDVVRWFPYYVRPTLREFGFRLVQYEVSEECVVKGRRQVAFHRSCATRITENKW